jgi:hypothetical protein
MSPAPRRNEGTAPTWKSWLVLLSLLTDPKYVAYRLGRRWARLRGKAPPRPRPFEPTSDVGTDLSSLEVDLVYLWVSGQDPKHREKRNYWLQQYGLPPKLFNPDVRYIEEDELRYSLRSVEAFVPWARKIFIVTDEQVPSWLNLAHPKIQLVEQASLMPDANWSPTFNSVAIEAQLHRIPGLAEHFLHVNDDFFFGQSVRQGDFFARLPDGRVVMKVMFSDDYGHYDVWITPAHQVSYSPLGRLWMYSYNNLKVLLESRRPWWKVRYTDFHQAQSMVKSELRRTTEVFPREYRQSSGSRFRNAHDINFMALTRYRCLQEGSAVPGYLSHRFFPHELDLQGYTRETLPALFCINAGLGDESLRQDRILARLFPQPSAFELP